MRSASLLFFLLLFFHQNGFAQTYKFRKYAYKEGLPQDYIYTLVQSNSGELWVGTGEGLASYDGKRFQIFNQYKDTLKFITTLFKDKSGNIWIGEFNGKITVYNYNSFRFLEFKTPAGSPISAITEDINSNIWVGTKSSGLKILSKNYKDLLPTFIKNCGVNGIVQDHAGYLWVATDRGLIRCRYTNNRLHPAGDFLTETTVSAVYYDKNTRLILAGTTESGLKAVNAETLKYSDILNSFSDENINIITSDKENNIWVSSYGSGIYKCRLNNKNLEIAEHFFEGTGLTSNYIKSLLIDRENNIWFGTYGTGLAQLLDHTFTIYTKSEGLPDNNIKAIDRDSSSNIYVATDHKVSILSKNSPEFNILENIKTESPITTIKTYRNFLLIGTENSGLYKYDTATRKVISFYIAPKGSLLNRINHVIADRWGNIWIATDGGLVGYHKHSKTFSVFTTEDGLPHNKIHGLFADSRNRIWLATHGSGLAYIKNGKITVYPSFLDNEGLNVNCFAEDKLGGLWVGTFGQGFFLFQNGEKLLDFNHLNGLGSPYCYFLTFDDNDRLWIGHKNGLSKFNTRSYKFVFFESDEENILAEVNHKASIKDASGNLWFGTVNGLIKYNPKADIPVRTGAIVNLKSILLNYQKVDWKKYSDSTYDFGQIPYRLSLPYNQNHLTFNVSGVTLRSGNSKVKFEYLLEGLEDSALVTHEPFVTYPHLPPGTYKLRITAESRDGIRTAMTPYVFTINSPFWQTWWFITGSVFTSFFLVTGYVKVRTDRLRGQREKLRKDKQILEAEIRERIKAQQQQKLVEEKLKQTNQELNNFIYRSSHDLRGPISTVKGLTQLGAIEVKDSQAQKFFALILDRTHVLDSVLKNLINIVEVIEGDIEVSLIDFQEIFAKNKEELLKNNKDAAIEIKLNHLLTRKFRNDFNLIDTVFKNIIDNSIKYRRANTDCILSVEVKESKEGVTLKFEDNGIGISDEIRPRIFDMFYRGTDESKGSGLGLYTVKKIVDKLNGSIEVISSVNKGTSVLIYLPEINT
jgi:ligand-binding sensor domain-containing protein/signal transduction histidine kinase